MHEGAAAPAAALSGAAAPWAACLLWLRQHPSPMLLSVAPHLFLGIWVLAKRFMSPAATRCY